MFIIVGLVFSTASSALRQQMPWLTIAVGAVMVVMGGCVARRVEAASPVPEGRLDAAT